MSSGGTPTRRQTLVMCNKCSNTGYYLDPQCIRCDCWHGERIVTHTKPLPTEQLLRGVEPEKTTTKIPKVMDCPERPCPCPLGNSRRLALRKRAASQV